jgi:hypothetical protein
MGSFQRMNIFVYIIYIYIYVCVWYPIVSYCFLLFPIVSFLEIQYDIPRLVTDGHGGSGASQCLSSQGTAFS